MGFSVLTDHDKWDEIIASGKFNGGEVEIHDGSRIFRADIARLYRDGDLVFIESSWGCVCDQPIGPFKAFPVNTDCFHSVSIPFEMQKNGTSTRIFMQPFPGDFKILFPNDYTSSSGARRSFQIGNPELVEEAKALNF